MKSMFLSILLLLATPAAAQPSLQRQVEARLSQAGPGVRFGLVVADEAGRELVAINPDGRFMPASNTKMLTTAAIFATFAGLDRPDGASGAAVRLEGRQSEPEIILEGHGDARLSSAAGCLADCLAMLADAVAARTKRVGNVIGDDSAFADERWSPGMSWNNIVYSSGTAVSALTLDDNEIALTVSPGAADQAPRVEGIGYYRIDNRARTVAQGETRLDFARLPGSRDLLLAGTVRADAGPQVLRLAIDDPAHYAAWRFKALLEARGVKVRGAAAARHRPAPLFSSGTPMEAAAPAREPLARLTPPPLAEDLARTNKESQNLHAELMLRRLGLQAGEARIAGGIKAVGAMLDRAGVPRSAWALADGSGMSTYNRLSPRGTVTLLRWISGQPWGEAWKATLPVAGSDGTLANRFKSTPLQGRLIAKTGTLNATSALSGFLVAKSGRRLAFSFYANDVPEEVKATEAMDAALALIAEAE